MKNSKNYLDFIPSKKVGMNWTVDEQGIVTLEVENKGFFNFLAQKLFKKPKISYVHLDELGSFVWPLINGEKDITAIGISVEEQFGEKAHPLYERLAKFFQVLQSYGFVTMK